LGRVAAVLLGGSVVEFGVVVDSVDVGGSSEFGDMLGSRLVVLPTCGGNTGTLGRFAEPASGDLFSICSSWL
jgi:hypothetical protein